MHLQSDMEDKKINEPNAETDLLTLNKQIVEEISEELANNFEGKNNRYVDPFKRRDQIDSKSFVFSNLYLKFLAATDNIEIVGSSTKMPKSNKHNKIRPEISEKNSKELKDDQDKIVDILADLVLDEYIKHENQETADHSIDQEQEELYRQRDKITNFMAGLNNTDTYGRDHIDPRIKDIGEQVFDEKIDSIFKDIAKDKKIESKKASTQGRRHTTQPDSKLI